jgi:hypothetical protein
VEWEPSSGLWVVTTYQVKLCRGGGVGLWMLLCCVSVMMRVMLNGKMMFGKKGTALYTQSGVQIPSQRPISMSLEMASSTKRQTRCHNPFVNR